MNDLFARVRPLVGEVLEGREVAVIGSPAGALLVEYLVACGVRRWLVMAGNGWIAGLVAKLGARYGSLIELDIRRAEAIAEIGEVDLALVVDDGPIACRLPVSVPRLAIFTPTMSHGSRAILAMVGERLEMALPINDGLVAGWDWLTAAPLMALQARALLLRGTPYRMRSWEEAWALGKRVHCPAMVADPTSAWLYTHTAEMPVEAPVYRMPLRKRGTLLIAGLGSLGSVAAEQLAPWVERLVLVDPDRVEMANLVRQSYSHCQIGKAKAAALAQRLNANHAGLVCEAAVASLCCEEDVMRLIERYHVTAALVTTGSHADFAIARALRAAGLPHVLGRCYARARFWEGIVVDAPGMEDDGGPSYDEVRCNVAAGPTPMPTPEEVASYGAVGGLVAEPATAMECGWAALWLARLTTQMMSPPALREGWLLARLAAGANCFIGGVVTEEGSEDSGEGGSAYGVVAPGEIHAWSLEEIG